MIVGVITDVRMGDVLVLVISIFMLALFQQATAKNDQSIVHAESLLQTSSSWDGEPYKSYPPGQPEFSILKITLAPHTQLEWHSHPMPTSSQENSQLRERKTEKSSNLLPDRQFPRPLTHCIGEWQEMSLLC